MDLPDFIRALPSIDVPLPEDVLTTNALQSAHGLGVFFTAHQDINLPPHSHKGQWGTVLVGSLELTIDGETTRYLPGQSYTIPAGTVHAVRVPAGSIVFDVFEEPDRYALRG